MSASLPNGTSEMAAAKRYAVATQLNNTASVWNSLPMTGNAMLIDEPMNGVMKELREAIINAVDLVALLSIRFTSFQGFLL
jgi:hypothetical protein